MTFLGEWRWDNWRGDAWGGLAAMLVALPSAIAFGVTILSPLGHEYAAQGAIAGILGAMAKLGPVRLGATPFSSDRDLLQRVHCARFGLADARAGGVAERPCVRARMRTSMSWSSCRARPG